MNRVLVGIASGAAILVVVAVMVGGLYVRSLRAPAVVGEADVSPIATETSAPSPTPIEVASPSATPAVSPTRPPAPADLPPAQGPSAPRPKPCDPTVKKITIETDPPNTTSPTIIVTWSLSDNCPPIQATFQRSVSTPWGPGDYGSFSTSALSGTHIDHVVCSQSLTPPTPSTPSTPPPPETVAYRFMMTDAKNGAAFYNAPFLFIC